MTVTAETSKLDLPQHSPANPLKRSIQSLRLLARVPKNASADLGMGDHETCAHMSVSKAEIGELRQAATERLAGHQTP